MARRRAGEVAKELLESRGETHVCYGHLDTLHDLSEALGHKEDVHPMEKLKRVLDTLARDSKRPGAVMSMQWGRWGLRGQLCRGFWVKGTEPEHWREDGCKAS
jgi:hypothetical protein